MRDIELLALEMAVLWSPDDFGRPHGRPRGALAVACDGERVAWSGSRVEVAPGDRAAVSGPSYLIENIPEVEASVRIVTSVRPGQPALEALRTLRPAAWWEPEEWDDLVAGRLGPWAIAYDRARVLALCHTPRAHAGAVEAGVWTHPDERRKGYATAVTARWATAARASGYAYLFYSTSADNLGSQSVAARVGARALGTIWQIPAAPPTAA